MSELKPLPCPFCGGINIINCGLHKYCHSCGAEGPDADNGTDAGLLSAWNRRAQPAQAGHVPEASCGECGKKASDGWALYCVACMEKAGLPAQAGRVLSDEDVLRAAARTLDSEVVEVSPLSCIKDFARAIEQAVLAKRVPMTPEETDAAMKLLFYPARNRAFIDGVEAAELHHGIVGEKGVA